MAERPDPESLCPECRKPIGDHTIRGYGDCLKASGFDYRLPYEDNPDGPLAFPGIEGELVGEVTVMPGMVDTAMGRMPVLRFVFTGPGPDPMSRRSLKPINLVMDANGLKSVRQLISTSVDRAVLAARRGR